MASRTMTPTRGEIDLDSVVDLKDDGSEPSEGFEIYLEHDDDLPAEALATPLESVIRLYELLSVADVDPADRSARLSRTDRLVIREISTRNSLTVLLVGAATVVVSIPGAPFVAGTATVGAVAALLVRSRRTWHEGTKHKAEAEKLTLETRILTDRVGTLSEEERLRERAAGDEADGYVEQFYRGLFERGDVRRAWIDDLPIHHPRDDS